MGRFSNKGRSEPPIFDDYTSIVRWTDPPDQLSQNREGRDWGDGDQVRQSMGDRTFNPSRPGGQGMRQGVNDREGRKASDFDSEKSTAKLIQILNGNRRTV
jgi:hypothetical protein